MVRVSRRQTSSKLGKASGGVSAVGAAEACWWLPVSGSGAGAGEVSPSGCGWTTSELGCGEVTPWSRLGVACREVARRGVACCEPCTEPRDTERCGVPDREDGALSRRHAWHLVEDPGFLCNQTTWHEGHLFSGIAGSSKKASSMWHPCCRWAVRCFGFVVEMILRHAEIGHLKESTRPSPWTSGGSSASVSLSARAWWR